MKITKATSKQIEGVEEGKSRAAAANPPGYDLIQLEFSDGTKFSIQSEELGFPRIYAHDLLDEYLKAGGKIA